MHFCNSSGGGGNPKPKIIIEFYFCNSKHRVRNSVVSFLRFSLSDWLLRGRNWLFLYCMYAALF